MLCVALRLDAMSRAASQPTTHARVTHPARTQTSPCTRVAYLGSAVHPYRRTSSSRTCHTGWRCCSSDTAPRRLWGQGAVRVHRDQGLNSNLREIWRPGPPPVNFALEMCKCLPVFDLTRKIFAMPQWWEIARNHSLKLQSAFATFSCTPDAPCVAVPVHLYRD